MGVIALRLACVAAVMLWSLAVCLIDFLPVRLRGWAVGAAILIGVPILGCATWRLGPLAGLMILALGSVLLIWPPSLAGRRGGGRNALR